MAELTLHTMAGMCWGLAHSVLQFHCVVAQGTVSYVFRKLLSMVATFVGVLLGGEVMLSSDSCGLPSSWRSSSWPSSSPSLTTWSMLSYDLPCAGLATIVSASIILLSWLGRCMGIRCADAGTIARCFVKTHLLLRSQKISSVLQSCCWLAL